MLSAVVLVILGGIMNGSFAVPMKLTRHWPWENTWLIYSFIGLLLIPIASAYLSVPHLSAVYRSSTAGAVILTVIFGFGWGLGSVLFGLGISLLGIALGFAVILGLTAVLGSLVPVMVLSPEVLRTARGGGLLVGLAIALGGIGLCARAGGLKSKTAGLLLERPGTSGGNVGRSKFRAGLLICIGSGVLSSMLNLALAFGSPIVDAAMRAGVTQSAAQNAIWALAVGAGSLANIGYTVWLLCRNGNWRQFGKGAAARNWLAAVAMGVLWIAGIILYGAGAAVPGKLGAVAGWPLFVSTVLIASNVWGFLMGEWKSATAAAVRSNFAGVAVLIVSVVIISVAGAS